MFQGPSCSMKKAHEVTMSPRQPKKAKVSCATPKKARSCGSEKQLVICKEEGQLCTSREADLVSINEVKNCLQPEMMINTWGTAPKDGKQGYNISRLKKALKHDFLQFYKKVFHKVEVTKVPMYMARCYAAWHHGINVDWDSVEEFAQDWARKRNGERPKQEEEELSKKEDATSVPSRYALGFIEVLDKKLSILKTSGGNEETTIGYESWRNALTRLENAKANSKYIEGQVAHLRSKLEKVRAELDVKRKELDMQRKLVETLSLGTLDGALRKLQCHEEAAAKKQLENEVEKMNLEEVGMTYMLNANLESIAANQENITDLEEEARSKEEVYMREKDIFDQTAGRRKRIQSFICAIKEEGCTLVMPRLMPPIPNEYLTIVKVELERCAFCGFGYNDLQYAAVISPCMHSFHIACALHAFKVSIACCLCNQEVSKDWLHSIGVISLTAGDDVDINKSFAEGASATPSNQRIASVVDSDDGWTNKLDGQEKTLSSKGSSKSSKTAIGPLSSVEDKGCSIQEPLVKSFGSPILSSFNMPECKNLQDELVEPDPLDMLEKVHGSIEDEAFRFCNNSIHEPGPTSESMDYAQILPSKERDEFIDLSEDCEATPKDLNKVLEPSSTSPKALKKEIVGKKGAAASTIVRRRLGLKEFDEVEDVETAKSKPRVATSGSGDKDAIQCNLNLDGRCKTKEDQMSPEKKNLTTISQLTSQGRKQGLGCSPAKQIMMQKKLLILDMNKVFVKRFEGNDKLPRRHARSTICKIGKFDIIVRPGHVQFVRECMKHFVVAIWSTMSKENLAMILNELFPQDVHSRFEFIWDQEHCEDTKLDHPFMPGRKIFLKDLKTVWSTTSYNSSNSLLVEDAEYKCLRNPKGSYIIPRSFSPQSEAGTIMHLTDELLPYLVKVANAVNVCTHVMRTPLTKSSAKETAAVKELLQFNALI